MDMLQGNEPLQMLLQRFTAEGLHNLLERTPVGVLSVAIPAGELLNLRNFKMSIPIYQRPYEWKLFNVDRLMDDIGRLLRSNTEPFHLLCDIVLLQVTPERRQEAPLPNWFKAGNQRICHVMDGQQRLTTMLLVFEAVHTWLVMQANR